MDQVAQQLDDQGSNQVGLPAISNTNHQCDNKESPKMTENNEKNAGVLENNVSEGEEKEHSLQEVNDKDKFDL